MNKEIIDLIKEKNLVKVRVRQLENKNQFVIDYNNAGDPHFSIVCFQSYATLIALWDQKEKILYINWSMYDYSKTTLKHLKIFINNYTSFDYESKNQFTKLILTSDHVKLFNER